MKKNLILFLLIFCLLAGLTARDAQAASWLSQPEKIVLKNGLTIYYLHNPGIPLVSFQMAVRGAGVVSEPAELEGLAGLTAELMTKGTSAMKAEEIAEALDFMGASFSISASEENTQVSASSLAEYFPRVLEIVAACLNESIFPEDEFSKEQKQRLDILKAVKDNPAQAVRYYFQKAYFGTHPMGRLSLGTETSLKKITVEKVRNFYKQNFSPDRAVAAIVGDIEKQTLIKLAERTIGTWQRNPAAVSLPAMPAIPGPKGRKLVLVDKPDATQAYFVLGVPGYPVGDKIAAQASVMNTLFGGRFTSWLNTELRIKRGLTYGASSSFRNWSIGGVYSFSSYTRNDKIGEMLDITFDLFNKAIKKGFSPEEVESSRNYILGQFPPTLETNASKASAYVRLAFYNLGFDYYDNYLKEINQAGVETVNKAAARLMPRDNFVLVVVGKATDIRKQLEKYGRWQEKKITDPDF